MTMSTTKRLGKGTRAARATQLVAGARRHFTNGGQTLGLAGALANVTVDQAVAELNELVANRAATATAQATARDKVQAERAATPRLVAFMNAFETLVRVTFGADTTALADFGLEPRKQPAARTATAKAVAAAKSRATREARGTKSPKAKKAVHGNVTATLVVTPATPTPAEAPQAPAPAAAPAPNGAAAAPPKG
jgi:hypothetical protein